VINKVLIALLRSELDIKPPHLTGLTQLTPSPPSFPGRPGTSILMDGRSEVSLTIDNYARHWTSKDIRSRCRRMSYARSRVSNPTQTSYKFTNGVCRRFGSSAEAFPAGAAACIGMYEYDRRANTSRSVLGAERHHVFWITEITVVCHSPCSPPLS
jgi:hypothetical protein